MRVIDQSFIELDDKRLYQKIEMCGRVCYKSEDKITETSALSFVKKICVNNHGSVLEHFIFVFKIDEVYYNLLKEDNLNFFNLTNITRPIVSFNLRAFLNYYNVDKNNRVLLPLTIYLSKQYPDLFEVDDEAYSLFEVDYIDDINILSEPERDVHQYISIKATTDRGVTHELVRHRLASFSQESTRYCNYSKDKFGNEITVIRPTSITEETYPIWKEAMEIAEKLYFEMVSKGASPQLARSVLPNSLKTEICITASLKEWKLIFDLRCAPQAHPDVRVLMNDIKAYFLTRGYIHDSN